MAPLVLAAVGVLLVVATVLVTHLAGDDAPAAAGEVFLESAADPGPDTFTDPVDPVSPASTLPEMVTDGPVAAPAAGTQPTSGTAPAPGSAPYGGSGDDRVCDREQLVGFLESNPERARAWAGVLGVSADDIGTYVRSLTPTVLLYDTRVTNHGFANGRATPRQSVLQAGTAVLVDANGDPVVRCRCGNPLQPPAPVATAALTGTPWPAFDPAALVAVDGGVTVTVSITVTVVPTPTTDPPPGPVASPAPDPTATAPGPVPTVSDLDRDVAEGLVAVVSECVGDTSVTVVSVEPVEGFTGSFTIGLDVGGTPMLFVYEPATGTVSEGDRASAELLAACGVS